MKTKIFKCFREIWVCVTGQGAITLNFLDTWALINMQIYIVLKQRISLGSGSGDPKCNGISGRVCISSPKLRHPNPGSDFFYK